MLKTHYLKLNNSRHFKLISCHRKHQNTSIKTSQTNAKLTYINLKNCAISIGCKKSTQRKTRELSRLVESFTLVLHALHPRRTESYYFWKIKIFCSLAQERDKKRLVEVYELWIHNASKPCWAVRFRFFFPKPPIPRVVLPRLLDTVFLAQSVLNLLTPGWRVCSPVNLVLFMKPRDYSSCVNSRVNYNRIVFTRHWNKGNHYGRVDR